MSRSAIFVMPNCVPPLMPYSQLNCGYVPCRCNLGYSFLCGIVPGTRDKDVVLDLNPFMQIVHDELRFLMKWGVKTLDRATSEEFTCRPRLVNIISDYHGLEHFLGLKGSPAIYPCFK